MNLPKDLKKSILEEAQQLISNDRRGEYGPVEESFEKIASLASFLISKPLSATDICRIMIAVKLAREIHKHKRDNLVDLAGYVGLLDQLETKVPAGTANLIEKKESYYEAMQRYLKDRELAQPKTGVMIDYRENAEKVGWNEASNKL